MGKSVAKNFFYNVIYQIVTLIIPIITIPYVSRVLGVEGVGINSYTFSIVQYFIIFGTLGIGLYGNRTIAFVRDESHSLAETFWSIVTLQIISTLVALLIFIFLFGNNSNYRSIYLIQSINIIAAAIDISWFFMGLEDFKKTVTRNLIVKVVGVVCIFLFVKTKHDLWMYILINGLMMLLGQVVMWIYIPKIIPFLKVDIGKVKKHFIPALKLFIPQIAIQIYVLLDKTMIGILSNTIEVGFYDQAQKIVKIALAIVTSTGTVMLPKMTNIFAKGDMKKMKEYLNKSLIFVSYISIPMMFGISGISKEFTPWFFGNEFLKVADLMVMNSPILLLIALSNVLGIQFMLPIGMNKEFTISVTIGAFVNFVLNLFLIKEFQSMGASLASVFAELAVTIIQYYYLKEHFEFKLILGSMTKFFISGILMLCVVKIIGFIMGIGIITTGIQVIVGLLIYIIVLLLLKDNINLYIINYILTKVRKRK